MESKASSKLHLSLSIMTRRIYNKLLPSGELETNFEERVSKAEVNLLESNLVRDVPSLLPYSISYNSHCVQPTRKRKGLYKAMNTRRQGHWEPFPKRTTRVCLLAPTDSHPSTSPSVSKLSSLGTYQPIK